MTRLGRLAAAVAVVASVATAVPAEVAGAQGTSVASPPAGRMAFTFVGVIEQNGPLAVDVGYITAIDGLDEEQLFTGTDPLARDESTARFTYFANARLERRSVNGNLFVTGGTAETSLFLQPDGGADFDDPTSFRRGTEIATFESRWHDVINVQAPDEGIARVESDDIQLTATPFDLDGESLVFGRPEAAVRLSFTGQGTRSRPEPPRATILYAGEATALPEPSAAPRGEAAEEPAEEEADRGGRGTSGWVWVALGMAVGAVAMSAAALARAAPRRGT